MQKSFAEYFQSVSASGDRFYQPDKDIIYFNERYVQKEFHVMFEQINLPISYEEIKRGVGQLRDGASAGPDFS